VKPRKRERERYFANFQMKAPWTLFFFCEWNKQRFTSFYLCYPLM